VSIGEPPTWTTFFDELDTPEPVRVAIRRAIERIGEADESFARRIPFEPTGVVSAVDQAYRRSEAVRAPWSPVFRSYFVESVAALALTRDASQQPGLTDEDVDRLLGDAASILDPLCAPA
jgi:hypothetical protein